MSRLPRSGLLIALGALALGACECIKTVPQCPDGVKCITYDQYCDQANPSLWAMGQLCGVIAKDVPYPAAYPQRDVRCTEALRALIDGGTVAFNAVAADECLAAHRSSCDDTCRWDLPLNGPWAPSLAPKTRCGPPCDRVFTGTKETGESCTLSVECLEGLFCDTTKSCPGRCARQHSVGELAPNVEACRSELALQWVVDGELQCDDLVDSGEPCSRTAAQSYRRCALGETCSDPPPSASDGGTDAGSDSGVVDAGVDGGADGGALDAGEVPVCVPWPDAGAIPPVDCDYAGCPFGQLCWSNDDGGASCRRYAALGASCLEDLFGGTCQFGLQCVPDGGTHVCAQAVLGTACDLDCAPDAFCGTDGGCTARAATGGTCASSDECVLGLICAAGSDAGFACGAPSVASQSCGDDGGHVCGFGFNCFDGGCVTNSCLPSP